jgi:glucosyl-3-phosphoglycerate synthase
VRHPRPRGHHVGDAGGQLIPGATRDASDGWFARRTSRADEHPPEELARLKAEQGLTVSVVLPARNEAATIQGVVRACAQLADSLVDELVVLDGGSTDGTADLAVAEGARVHIDRQVLADHGPPQGKGDALWRGLSVTSGDLVVFIDTDIRNPDPRFVWGLLGPLLRDQDTSFVKAFYDRPVQLGAELHPSGGGRVTELMARPLLNLFWPQLAGLVQPLSGEYAGRRELLESLPFFTGYGVELGLLVDILASRGPEAIAQVDLYERVHRNQDVAALSRMAFGILQVAMRRLGVETAGGTPAGDALRYLQFVRDEGHVRPHSETVGLIERPPLRSLG